MKKIIFSLFIFSIVFSAFCDELKTVIDENGIEVVTGGSVKVLNGSDSSLAKDVENFEKEIDEGNAEKDYSNGYSSSKKNYEAFQSEGENSFAGESLDAVSESGEEGEALEEEKPDYLHLEVSIPSAKRPKKPDSEKLRLAKEKDDDNEEFEKNTNTIRYGTPSEISDVIKSVTESEDPRYCDELYDLFQTSNGNDIKGSIIDYFAKQEDPCLEDFAVEIVDDPYDTPSSLVEKCFNYVSEVHCKEAGPALVKLLEGGDEKYFNGALAALGKTGGEKEAVYLADYLKHDDLTVPQRQALMRTLGEMCAAKTWDQLSEIAKDEDENSFVRMYAAEAIGKMKNKDSIPILEKLYAEGDPNMRQYCVKGLSNYEDDERAKKDIIQAIRDDHYKVRVEAIQSVKKQKNDKAVDFLIYRAKNDTENVVKNESYIAIAELNTKKGNDFLIEQIQSKKVGDGTKALICENLVKNGTAGESEIIELGKTCAEDNKLKKLRDELGKIFIKYPKDSWKEICSLYLKSSDVTTVSQGLTMFKNSKYSSAKEAVENIAKDKKANASNRKRARKLLGLPEEDETEEKKDANASEKSEKNTSKETDAK